MKTPPFSDRLIRGALLLVAFTLFNFGCGTSGSDDKPTKSALPVDSASGEKKKATIKLLSKSVFIQSVGNAAQDAVEGLRELQDGDSITTNETGEGALEFDSCKTIYVYQQTTFKKGACPKFDAQLGDNYCTEEGTTAFKDCASKLITQSNSATVTLLGTWASVTYLPERELTVVILFEGSAEATPVTDTSEGTLGKTDFIPAEHFWFSVPDKRLKELAALDIGLAPRTVYPFKKLPQLLARGDLGDLPIESVVKQAIKDNPEKPGLREIVPKLPASGPDHETGPDGPTAGGERDTGGPGFGLPPRVRRLGSTTRSIQDVVAYGHTKLNDQATKEFPTRNGSLLRTDSVSFVPAGGPFRVSDPSPTSPARLDVLSVAFAPTSQGHHTGTLRFRDFSGRQYVYRLTGDASTPSLQLSSSSLPFSGEKRPTDRLQLTSNGEVPAEIGKISLMNNPDGHFRILSDTCTNRSLNKNEQCEIIVAHTRLVADLPGASRDVAQLSLDHDSPLTPKLVEVSAPVLPTLEIAEGLSFGSIALPGNCDKTLTLGNNADTPLSIGKADLDRITGEGFTIAEDTCSNTTLAPQRKTHCSIKVRFGPSMATSQEAKLNVPHVSANGSMTRTVKLSGQGEAPILKFAPNVGFGSLQLGASEKIETISVDRLRGPAVEIKRVEISGPGKADFQIRGETCTQLLVSQRCEVRVAFKPTAEGLRQAEVILVGSEAPLSNASSANATSPDNSCGREYRLSLEGKAYAASSVNATSLCFGGKSVLKGADPKPRTLQLNLKSESRDPLALQYSISGDASDDFSVTSKQCEASGKACTLGITFAPKSTGKRLATISIAPNGITPPSNVELFGRGKSPNPFRRFGRWVTGLFTDQSAKACRR